MKLLLVAINAKYIHSSLAVRYLKKYCGSLPCTIEIAEFTINSRLLEIADRIFDQKPDLVGIECCIWNIGLVRQLLPIIHKTLPHAGIICGGPEISYNAEVIMKNLPMIDYIIRGEGEQPLYALLQNLLSGTSAEKIPGVACRAASGRIIGSEPVVLADINGLPFPYSDENMADLDNRIIYYESSRGCPFSCKYCLSCATSGVRYRSVGRVIDELSFFIRHNVKQVKFVDRTFNASREHFIPILKFLAVQKCRTNFHFEAAIDHIDAEALSILKTMPPGRIQLEIGIQSTNPETLKQVSRSNNWQKIAANINTILSFGNIHVHADLIIGLPYEDMPSLRHSFNQVYSLYPDMLQVGFLKLLKGSAMEDLVDEHGYEFMDTAPYQVLSNLYLSAGEMRFLRIFVDVFELYYNSGRFKYTLKYLIGCHADDAFSFFRSLAEFWHAEKLDQSAHAPKSLYKYLADFIDARTLACRDIALELLKFDALCSDGGRFRAEFLAWSEKTRHKTIEIFWKNTAAVKKYIPDYTFTSWRALREKYHIEYFSADVLLFARSEKIAHKNCIVLFIYEENNVKKISMDSGDFFL